MGLAAACVAFTVCVTVAVFATGSRFRPWPAWLAAIAGASCGVLIPAEHTFLRFLAAALGFVLVMRVADLRLDRRPWSPAMRVWLYTGLVDVRDATREAIRIDAWHLVAIVLYVGLGVLGWWLAHATDVVLLRWLGGVLFIYGLADAACGIAVPVYALAGWRIPPQHRAPILATSVGAFWSRHYNLNVSAWLARHIHRPFARRGQPRLGLFLAFGVSAAAHVFIALVPLDLAMALSWGAFFCVQGVGAVIERTWSGFAKLPTPARRAWTIAWLLLPSPLFVEPFLRIFEGA